MSIKITTQPSVEPVTLAEAKLHLRVDIADDDTLITSLIAAARQQAENITRRALCTQSWVLVLDSFPSPSANVSSANWYGPQWGIAPGPLSVLKPDGKSGFEIFLPLPPLASVESIKYIDTDGTQITLANTEYKVDLTSEPARIVPAYGKAWPATRSEIAAVEVAFTCGYGAAAAAVPQGIKNWMLLRIGAMYENREEIVVGSGVNKVQFVDGLLDQFRVVSF